MQRFAILLLLFLGLSTEGGDAFPRTLSETRLFRNLQSLEPVPELRAYDINVPFWSDGAQKRRWMRLPAGRRIHFNEREEWSFPPGTLFVKHFSSANGQAIETRLLFIESTNVLGASYRWRSDGSDADLLKTNLLAEIPVAGEKHQNWYFPSSEDCRTCHNANAGLVLGVNTRQINRAIVGNGSQLAEWNKAQLFDRELTEKELHEADALSLKTAELSMRSYLDVNCAFCHRPGGTVSYFDARWSSPLERLIDAPVYFNQGVDSARVVAPRDPWRSLLLLRLQNLDGLKMPPLAHERVDTKALRMFTSWVESFPGPPVTPPPKITPPGAEYSSSITVSLESPEPETIIRYTTDGAPPGKNAAVYTGPITLRESATIRARAYKEGWTRSVSVQETFVISR
jgi:hypothetical protein